MTDMVTKLRERKGISLDKLDLSTGIIAFDNSEEMPLPFIVAWPWPGTLKEGHVEDISRGLRLIHYPQKGMRKEWTLPCDGSVLRLWSPNILGGKESNIYIPNISIDFPSIIAPYLVGTAYSGKEEIAKALEEMKVGDMDFYAHLFR